MTTSTNSLNLAVVGNSNIAALIDQRGSVVWCCVPRFDGDPVFCSLLNNGDGEKGFWDVELFDFARSEQRYRPNSAVVITTLYDEHGGVVEITRTSTKGLDSSRTAPGSPPGTAPKTTVP